MKFFPLLFSIFSLLYIFIYNSKADGTDVPAVLAVPGRDQGPGVRPRVPIPQADLRGDDSFSARAPLTSSSIDDPTGGFER